MTAPRSVLCALGGTDRDGMLVAIGASLADRTGSALSLLETHLELSLMGPDAVAPAPIISPQVEAETTAERERRLQRLAGSVGHPEARCEALPGPAQTVLSQASQRDDVAWLVAGDRGGSVLRAVLQGSVTRGLLDHAGCPVAVVTPDATTAALTDPHAVVCAVGESAGARRTVEVAAELAGALDTTLVVVHAVDDDGGPRQSVDPLLGELLSQVPAGVPARGVAVTGSPVDALVDALHEEHAGVVVTGAPGRGLLRAALGGSVPHTLLGRLDRQIAVVVPDH
ncbi:universal stress protein [Baekduia soli]|uniref:Universal stress protein n=1 Tax=Baekduia soli TaxID=496014 RepID=A0A5B8U5W1_9ACTN|nr:universal stress protein [Baekduia soli]QEC48275.1 universal stress protein [Baekduia soli]